ncbi:MAG TPA: sulfurtransferase [Ilumatobacteraceae bacterium]|nr:sulfurtransferase [Ilumatobacteraceae bacterium]
MLTPDPEIDSGRPSPLVSTDWLADHLDDPQVRVVDCRWYLAPFDLRDGLTEFEAGHIPGAVHLAWDRDIADPARGSLNMLAGPQRYAEAMGRLGIGDDTFVVTYDDHHVPVAARVWWTLQVYGHTNAAVLDGGITAWVAEGRPTESGPPPAQSEPAPVFTPRFQPNLYATKEQVLEAVRDQSTRLVDARMDVAYAAASGHIPGSIRVTGLGFLDDGQHWRSPDASRARIEAAGAAGAAKTILYCGGGVAATGAYLGWLLAGLGEGVSVYDGSWGEWEQDPSTPKEAH